MEMLSNLRAEEEEEEEEGAGGVCFTVTPPALHPHPPLPYLRATSNFRLSQATLNQQNKLLPRMPEDFSPLSRLQLRTALWGGVGWAERAHPWGHDVLGRGLPPKKKPQQTHPTTPGTS